MNRRILCTMGVIGFLLLVLTTSVQADPWGAIPNLVTTDEEFTMSVALADLDNDDDLDLIAGNYNYPYQWDVNQNPTSLQTDQIGAYLVAYEWNEQTETFGPPVNLSDEPRCIDCIAIGDCDGDGDMDIAVGAVVGKGGDGGVWVYYNQLDPENPPQTLDEIFSDEDSWHPEESPDHDPSYDAHCVRWADVDCDGDLDLTALKVPGILYIHENVGGPGGGFEPAQVFDFISDNPLFNSSSCSGSGEELCSEPVEYNTIGTTMEFGDMDLDGDLDVFLNIGTTPTVAINQFQPGISFEELYSKDFWTCSSATNKDNQFCASFGFYVDNPNPSSLALVIGSYDFKGGGGSPWSYPWGNDIYVLNLERQELYHVWKGYLEESINGPRPQLVTDIQWAYLNDGSAMDLVAVSYPTIMADQSWDRGKEQVHLDPSTLINSTDNWTDARDRSTSLALGDIDQGTANYDTVKVHKNDPRMINDKRLIYAKYFPFIGFTNVWFEWEYEPVYLETNPQVSYDTQNGWFSVEPGIAPAPPLQWDYLVIEYKYSTELDLAVGNDGENVVYFYNGSGSTYEPTNTHCVMPVNSSYTYDPDAYGIDPEDPDLTLMAEDPIGATEVESAITGYNFFDVDAYLKDRPYIKRMGFMPYWSHTEFFQGHYLWDWFDKKLETARQNDCQCHLCSWDTPIWTKAEWEYLPDDTHNRTSDERLHAMFVRNLVNRYRPNGLLSSIENNGYNWNDWGVEIFQFENEPNFSSYGYGYYDDALADCAEKMYREYQMIKTMSDLAYGDVTRLEVVSPNFGQTQPDDTSKYVVPPMPYLNDLNDEESQEPDYDYVLWNYCDYVSQQSYCAKRFLPTPDGWDLNDQDPFAWVTCRENHPEDPRMIGIEHVFWAYYTEGLGVYLSDPISNWAPVLWDPNLEEYHEHPFFVMEWSNHPYYDASDLEMKRAWNASQMAEMFSVDVFPLDENKIHRLLMYNYHWGSMALETDDIFGTFAKLLTGTTFYEYEYECEEPLPDPTDYVKVTYTKNRDNPGQSGFDDFVTVLRTYEEPKEACNFELTTGITIPTENCRVPVHQITGDYMDRGINVNVIPPPEDRTAYEIEFAENELRENQVFIVDQNHPVSAATTYSQAIQLERGWNLVSWYIIPPDPTPLVPGLTMDDLFDKDQSPWGPQSWFDSDRNEPILDWVGRHDKDPHWYPPNPPELYPWYGYDNAPPPYGPEWEWEPWKAYYIHLNSPAHFWEFQNSQDYNQGSFEFATSPVWDDSIGIPQAGEKQWFFLGYPLRKSQLIAENPTIQDLETQNNPLVVLKSDDGRIYVPTRPERTNLYYLEPGEGYFIGFEYPETDKPCLGFEGESEPESIPPDPKSQESFIASSQPSHFIFKSGTHWWYPIVVDSVDLGETPPEEGDELGIFDGDLCVGVSTYEGEFPVILAAWRDDIATPDTIDGYIPNNEMTFVWYDKSDNQEITFAQPPQTQSMQDDPIAPMYSGFGCGFYAVRNLTSGIQSVVQLPKEFKIGQNYPNPFNAETIIPLQLPQRSRLMFEIYNIRGQIIRKIDTGSKSAGKEFIYFNAADLSSGIYFYCISAEGLEHKGRYCAVGKMLLLK